MPAIVSIVPETAADTTVNAQDPEHKAIKIPAKFPR